MMPMLVLVLLIAWVVNLVNRRAPRTVAAVGATVPWTPTSVVRVPSSWPAIRALGRVEARQLRRHPLVVAGLLLAMLGTGLGPATDSAQAFFELTGSGGSGLYLPPLLFLGAHLDATRARRAGTQDLLAATPSSAVDRTLGSCLAGVVVAGAVFVIVLLGLALYQVTGTDLPRSPGVFELLLLPLSSFGAVALGTMAGRWAPWRGAGPPLLVLLVAGSIAISGISDSSGLFLSYVDLVPWEATEDPAIAAHVPVAHAGYLLGLDAMAVVGAVLRDRRTRLWWALGFLAVAWTAAMGLWQAT